MVKVKLQKHKVREYVTYLITLPRAIVESTNFAKAKTISIKIKDKNTLIVKKD